MPFCVLLGFFATDAVMTKKHPMSATRRIALAFPNTMVIAGNMMNGILAYARARAGWVFTRMPEQIHPSTAWLRRWRGEGAIAALATEDEARMARRLPFPVVNLVGYLDDSALPTVSLDNREIGRLQAEHLLERCFRRLVYYGVSDLWYSRERLAGFEAAARANGVRVESWLVPSGIRMRDRWTNQQTALAQRLKRLKPPFAVAASTDLRASMVLEACARSGFRVPEDVAVIGMDNDPTVAPFSSPPLSSIARNDRELGYQAARLLDALMSGRDPKTRRILIAPEGVVARRSTETLAVDAPELTRLICEIREHLAQPFGVEFLLSRSRLSRRQLERLFQDSLGCSPYALINRLRVERADHLLTTRPDDSLTEIAAACGFPDLRRFRLTFQRLNGFPPAAFRRQALGGVSQPLPL